MSPKILVLSASVGAGHLRAAQAVELALRELAPDATVQNVDVLTLTNAAFRQLYGKAYLDLVNKAPHVLGYFYDYMDRPRDGDSKRDKLRAIVERINLHKFCDLIECESWDVIVNTHFLPASIIAAMRKERAIKTPQITATTDFETHRLWVNDPCDHYCTATAEGASYLQHFGVGADRLSVTGIPIHPVFARERSRNECLARYGLKDDCPVILQLSGGFGVGPIEKLFTGLTEVQSPLQIVTVTGKNTDAKKKLESVNVPSRHRAKIFGFTDQIDELMACADIVVSKPGGLTTSEVLARGAAMVIVNPIPGQESRNSDYLLENGAGIKINNVATMAFKIEALLRDATRLRSLKQSAKRIATPRAAFDVARVALSFVSRATASAPRVSQASTRRRSS